MHFLSTANPGARFYFFTYCKSWAELFSFLQRDNFKLILSALLIPVLTQQHPAELYKALQSGFYVLRHNYHNLLRYLIKF